MIRGWLREQSPLFYGISCVPLKAFAISRLQNRGYVYKYIQLMVSMMSTKTVNDA